MRRVAVRSSPHAPRNRTVGVLHDRMRYHTNKGVGVRPKGPDNSFIETEYKKVRPRSIPHRIWKRIKIISIELGLIIPDTLDLLADIYEDLKRGELVEVSKCWEVIER